MKENSKPYIFNSLSELHKVLGLPNPVHPLISIVNNSHSYISEVNFPRSFVLNFFKIAYKPNLKSGFKYGESYHDFEEGGLCFSSPLLPKSIEEIEDSDNAGFALFIHPDFLLGSPLASKIKQYNFFSYSVNEALHLSEKEKRSILSVIEIIGDELDGRIDEFCQDIVIAQIDLLLNYCNRFYKRQFITRKTGSNDILKKLDNLLEDYFTTEKTIEFGVPTVHYLAEQIHITSGYLSDMLRLLIGQNAQQYIHQNIIERAKEKLVDRTLSVSEIAYELGFEHSQSFNKLFKSKTNMTPLGFRQSFN
ncbi:helix-turn-helix domain-containing protein [Chryseobacterium sp. ISL-6]|uniref:helix-turn-helix domain-containing protein n=1 Tax=Chryseobacterium sp. ISL-6 TaxID=2819143 RepID=UPI001BEBE968|nr:helix-turn-helix domain-containing protein [Chryseobacterium sp. ISL-6]MBT2622657.1 AraC family transcriptional regulator [Chryseobacterium sp. ISL-6]